MRGLGICTLVVKGRGMHGVCMGSAVGARLVAALVPPFIIWSLIKISPPKFFCPFDTGGEVLYNQNAFEKAHWLHFSTVYEKGY